MRHADDELYPPCPPDLSGMLAASATHTLAWRAAGRRDGVPALLIHGGPGGGACPVQRRLLDPGFYRIVQLDQRGCGESRPHAETAENTTADLIADMERLRRHLGIARWLLVGGSWGATLALGYAQAHPERVRGLILRGVFLGRAREIRWFLSGMGTIFPEAWGRFAGHLAPAERGDLLHAYHARLMHPDPRVHLPAACAWARYEAACCSLIPSDSWALPARDPAALALARLEAHYFIHNVFLGENALLAGMPAIRHLPAAIVQGRYDMVCPIASADALRRAWPEAAWTVVPDAGHAALEPGIRRAVMRAAERFKTLR